jgi:hypothetical protein
MALSAAVQKTLVIKPEVNKIFDDLDKWLDHCRINLLKYDPKDLYKSKEYKEWAKANAQHERKYKKHPKQQGN